VKILSWRGSDAKTPLDLQFSLVAQRRPIDLVAPNFTTHSDRFDSAKGLRGYEEHAPTPENRPANVDRRHGTLSLSGEQPFFTLFKSETHQSAPYSAVTADVSSFAGCNGEQDAVFVGLVKDDSNYLMAWFSHASGAAGIDAVVDGSLTTLGAVDTPIVAPCRVAFCLTGTVAAAMIDDGQGFRPLVRGHLPDDMDLRRPTALNEYHNGFGARASVGTITLTGVEAGFFGQTGLRDPHVVTHADGSPYVKYGKAFLTMTHGGLGFFDTAHWGVWTLDLTNYELEQVSNLFFRRDGSGSVFGDHAGHLVRDDDNGRWVVATSTWGDFSGEGVEVHYATLSTSTNLLHGVHVLDSEQLKLPVNDLPSEAVGQWDPHLVRVGDRWYVGFVNARAFFDFFPALARSEPGGDFTELSLVGADPGKTETEGVVIHRFGDQWYVLASNGDNSPEHLRDQYPVYDLSMTELGTLDAPHPANIPWPTVLPVSAPRDRTRWLMVTFDGTAFDRETLGYGNHGDLLVLESKQQTRGREFEPRPS
jgi:hypothetical protein